MGKERMGKLERCANEGWLQVSRLEQIMVSRREDYVRT